MRKTLIRWWLFTVISLCSAVGLWHFGIFHDIYKADVTNITFIIYAVFISATVLAGITAYRVARQVHKVAKTNKYISICWFLSEAMMTLGLIGTVAGMIYLFGQVFTEIDPSNPEDLKEALSHMATGLSTAMYTTICGMVGSLIVKIHLMNIEFDHNE
jgi:ABC-type thiamin/hydroxymethylpyrimidine transport system permease subunit